jgi:membrane-bound lytic murein transglycosylase D
LVALSGFVALPVHAQVSPSTDPASPVQNVAVVPAVPVPDATPTLQDATATPPAPAPAEAAAAPAPVAAPAPKDGLKERAAAGLDPKLFPRYPSLEPKVSFWTKVFSEYSENQSVIHSIEYPGKVFEVLDFRAEALRVDKNTLARIRNKEESEAKNRADTLLKQVDALRSTPERMNAQQRRIYQLYADVKGDDRFRKAVGTLRAQRGLKERTALALETSGKYLPQMEGIFAGYSLPTQLTRLPLVESSFNVEAYSKVGAAGLWQFMPSSAKIYMRLNEVVDDRRDPWTSTDGAARHLRDDYAALGSWPLALTAYNHGRGGIARGLQKTGGKTLPDLIDRYDAKSFGFASQNFYAEFLAAYDVEREWKQHFGENLQRKSELKFDTVETKHYVPYETLRRLCDADDELFRKLNPAYRPEVIEGKLYVPPGHLIRVPAGHASAFNVAYAKLGSSERFDSQRTYYLLHKVKRGDTIGGIAREYGVSQAAVMSANGIRNSAIRIGQVLKVPPRQETRPGPVVVAVGESKPALTPSQTAAVKAERAKSNPPKALRVHKVQSGQTLSGIAKRYKVSIASLRDANDIDGSHIRVGQKLTIPSS